MNFFNVWTVLLKIKMSYSAECAQYIWLLTDITAKALIHCWAAGETGTEFPAPPPLLPRPALCSALCPAPGPHWPQTVDSCEVGARTGQTGTALRLAHHNACPACGTVQTSHQHSHKPRPTPSNRVLMGAVFVLWCLRCLHGPVTCLTSQLRQCDSLGSWVTPPRPALHCSLKHNRGKQKFPFFLNR